MKSSWKDEELYRRIASKLDGELPGLEAFVVDDTGFAKKGVYSLGVSRQYSGTLGRTDNTLGLSALPSQVERSFAAARAIAHVASG